MAAAPVIIKIGCTGAHTNFDKTVTSDGNNSNKNFSVDDANSSEEELYICKLCSIGFTEEHLYDNHMFYHSVNREEKPIVVKSVLDILPKSKDASQQPLLQCVTAGSNSHFAQVENLPVQTEKNPSKKLKVAFNAKQPILPKPVVFSYTCKICFKSFPTVSNLAVHILDHSKSSPYSCDICGKSFKKWQYLSRHYRNHKCGDNFFCKLCKKYFLASADLRIHSLLEHSGSKSYPCPTCNKKFRTRGSMRTHLQSHADEKQFLCQVCNQTFKHVMLLQKHSLVHSNTVQYMCELCRKSFSSQSAFDKHHLIHSSELSFSCTRCDRVFSTERNCKIHMHYHERRKYYCPVCNRHCISAKTLGKHALCHRKYGSFTCMFCLKECKDKAGFMRHFLNHTNEMPFGCHICEDTFIEEPSYVSRTMAHHAPGKDSLSITGNESISHLSVPSL